MPSVFVSYSRTDEAAVKLIINQIRSSGLTPVYDTELRAGGVFPKELEEKIRSSDCVLVVWSSASHKSTWVQSEALIGLENEKLVALRIDDTPISTPPFNAVHYIDIRLNNEIPLPDKLKIDQELARFFSDGMSFATSLSGEPFFPSIDFKQFSLPISGIEFGRISPEELSDIKIRAQNLFIFYHSHEVYRERFRDSFVKFSQNLFKVYAPFYKYSKENHNAIAEDIKLHWFYESLQPRIGVILVICFTFLLFFVPVLFGEKVDDDLSPPSWYGFAWLVFVVLFAFYFIFLLFVEGKTGRSMVQWERRRSIDLKLRKIKRKIERRFPHVFEYLADEREILEIYTPFWDINGRK